MNQLNNYGFEKPPSKAARDKFKAALKRFRQIETAINLRLISPSDPAVKEAVNAMTESFNKEFLDEL